MPVFAARARPHGRVTEEAYSALLDRMNSTLDRAGRLDGVLAAPHGAMVAEPQPAADGHWLGLLRGRFPRPLPVVATLDPHANLSPAMAALVA